MIIKPPSFTQLIPDRVANAMWDFSWLYQHHEGGAFADWDKCFDEAIERGFGAVRIDAFPLIIGKLANPHDEVTFAADPHANWGIRDRERKHRVGQELVTFVRKAKEHGLYVILSSWGQGCLEWSDLLTQYAPDPLLLAQAWDKVLQLLGENDLLSHILYVDLDQEFPYFSPYQPELNRLGEGKATTENAMDAAGRRDAGPELLWNRAQSAFVRSVMETSIKFLQERHPGLRFTFSLTSYIAEVRALRPEFFDVLELHFWIHGHQFDNRSGFYRDIVKDRTNKDGRIYQERIAATLRSSGYTLEKKLRNQLAFGKSFADELGVPLTTTEAWGPWWHMEGPGFEWDWLKEWCAHGQGTLAREYGLWSSTPWNYAHPYWDNWSDIEWYRTVNRAFLG